MKKIFSFLFLLFISIQIFAEIINPKSLIREVNRKFNLVNDYKANVNMQFDIPGVKMRNLSGKVFFKKPSKFRIKAKGIFFLPKQNPIQNVSALLADTNSYTTIISGYETIQNKNCAIVNIIPLKTQDELIIGKFWVDVSNPLINKSQITTKNNGTIETQSFYGDGNAYNLPSNIVITVEINKVKVPKMLAIDLNKKSKPKENLQAKETGTIKLFFSNYTINKSIEDKEFTEQ